MKNLNDFLEKKFNEEIGKRFKKIKTNKKKIKPNYKKMYYEAVRSLNEKDESLEYF